MSVPRSRRTVLESVTVRAGVLLVVEVLAWLDGPTTERLGATWVVVDPRVGEARPGGGFEQVWSRAGWSLWRRA